MSVHRIDLAIVFVAGALLAVLLMLAVPVMADEPTPATPTTTIPVAQRYPESRCA